MSFVELSNWLGEPNTCWVEALAARVDINTLTLQHISELHLEFRRRMLMHRPGDGASSSSNLYQVNIIKSITLRLEAFDTQLRRSIDLFKHLEEADETDIYEKLIAQAGFPTEPMEVSSWRFSDSEQEEADNDSEDWMEVDELQGLPRALRFHAIILSFVFTAKELTPLSENIVSHPLLLAAQKKLKAPSAE
ncbi:hypothetical protein Leryth_010427 [Lithospermum erythrorhizon]|nr:hypothetical protein Leryth_010427 [Lithospermum erythrorhizon]